MRIARGEPVHILIVEDDLDLAAQLEKSLTDQGHEVAVARDGEEGLAKAGEYVFDAMVVDRMMPRLDGLTMLSRLRDSGNKTPTLILSALGQVDDRVEGLRAGGDDTICGIAWQLD